MRDLLRLDGCDKRVEILLRRVDIRVSRGEHVGESLGHVALPDRSERGVTRVLACQGITIPPDVAAAIIRMALKCPVSAGAIPNRRGPGRPARVSAGPAGAPAAERVLGLRPPRPAGRSPRTSPRRARSCGRPGVRPPRRAGWRAGRATSRSTRCGRSARTVAGGTTSLRSSGTRHSRGRWAGSSDRSAVVASACRTSPGYFPSRRTPGGTRVARMVNWDRLQSRTTNPSCGSPGARPVRR